VCKLEGVRNASCYLLSRIGAPIDEPNEVNVEVEAEQGAAALENDIRALVEATLSDWRRFQRGFLEHEWSLF
jgi:S-adenosylmethionine synthetase